MQAQMGEFFITAAIQQQSKGLFNHDCTHKTRYKCHLQDF